MCGGFNCSKNALTAINILFLIVSFVLIGVASYAKASSHVVSFEIAGGIIACGLFLFIISVLGLVAAYKHHQILLFFYFVILFLLFLIQFSVSIACLALSIADERRLLSVAWDANSTNEEMRKAVKSAEIAFNCCGWDENYLDNSTIPEHCTNVCLAPGKPPRDGLPPCRLCSVVIPESVGPYLVATGGIGFFFSLMELLGVYLAVRYRNQKDPKANPSQFL